MLLVVLAQASTPVLAVERVAAESYQAASETVHEQEIWVIADTVQLPGTFASDVSAMGSGVQLNGRYQQSVAAAATSNLTFTGRAEGILRLAGRYLQLDGVAEKSVAAAGLTIAVTSSNRFEDTVALLGDTVVTDGEAQGDVWLWARTSATIQGRIHGNVHARAQDIVVVPGTVIHGDFIYSAPRDIVLSNRVRVDGRVERRTTQPLGLTYTQFLILHVFLLGGAFLVGIPFVRLFPRTVVNSTRILAQAPGRSALTGIVILLVIPLTAIALFFPVALPLSLVILASIALLAYTAQLAVGLTLGGLLLQQGKDRSPPRPLHALSAGLVILYLSTAIPIVSTAIWILVVTAGMGSLALGIWSSQQLLPEPIYPGPPDRSGAPDSRSDSKPPTNPDS